MSIINEALKKAENTKDFKPLYSEDKFKRNIELETYKQRKQINWGPIFVLMVLFLITGPLIAPVFSTTFKRASFPVAALSSGASYLVPAQTTAQGTLFPSGAAETRQAQFGLEEMPLNPTAVSKPFAPMTAPRLNLTGIVYGEKTSYCILNNKVIRVGEEINGAKLVEVQPHQAKLLYHGEEITLAIPE